MMPGTGIANSAVIIPTTISQRWMGILVPVEVWNTPILLLYQRGIQSIFWKWSSCMKWGITGFTAFWAVMKEIMPGWMRD